MAVRKSRKGLRSNERSSQRKATEDVGADNAAESPSTSPMSSGNEGGSGGAWPNSGGDAQPELTDTYGDNHIYVMVRDPYWLFSYWEIRPEYQDAQLSRLGGSWDKVNTVARAYDVSEEEDFLLHNFSLSPGTRNWYFNVKPNRSYCTEIGLLHDDGRYLPLARSNVVRTPREGMSEIIDELWMGIDFDAMYAYSGGFDIGVSSAEVQKGMRERWAQAITSGSGAVSSLASPVKYKERGFRFMLDCELIVYGATEPDAKVTLQGQPVTLRPDGTFTLRFALPDGYYEFDARAESADGKEIRTIIPVVQRSTQTPKPVVLEEAEAVLA